MHKKTIEEFAEHLAMRIIHSEAGFYEPVYKEVLKELKQFISKHFIDKRIIEEAFDIKMPNEYSVREYKTMEAGTYDEKQLVIEALQDIKHTLLKNN